MEIIERIREVFSGDNGDGPPSLEEIKQVRKGVREELREVEARLEEMEGKRSDLLLEGSDADLDAHDREAERLEREAERLETAVEELASRAKEAKAREKLQRAHELAAGLPELADAFETADRELREAQDRLSGAVNRLHQLHAALRRRGGELYLPDADVDRLERILEMLPGEHNIDFLRAPPEPDPSKPRMVVHVFEDGQPRDFFGDWSKEELRQVAASGPNIRDSEGNPRDRFHGPAVPDAETEATA